jgi:response regulator of citrate/malate metabolism
MDPPVGMTRLQAATLLFNNLPNVAFVVCALERTVHQIRHFHFFIEFGSRRTTSSIQIAAALGHYGHLSRIYDDGFLEYLIKDDDDWVVVGATQAQIRERIEKHQQTRAPGQQSVEVVRAIKNGATADDILLRFPGIGLTKYNILERLVAKEKNEQKAAAEERARLPWKPIDLAGLKGNNLRVAKWLNWITTTATPDRQRHLFIWGKGETGKSRFVNMLKRFFRVYEYNTSEKYQENFEDMKADIILVDEFCDDAKFSGMKIQHYNNLLDGAGKVPVKYQNAYQRDITLGIPCIFIGNVNPGELFPEDPTELRAAFLKRFFDVETSSDEITLFKEYWDTDRMKLANFYDDNSKVVEVIRLEEPNEKLVMDFSTTDSSGTYKLKNKRKGTEYVRPAKKRAVDKNDKPVAVELIELDPEEEKEAEGLLEISEEIA